MMLPPRQVRVFARLARWQLFFIRLLYSVLTIPNKIEMPRTHYCLIFDYYWLYFIALTMLLKDNFIKLLNHSRTYMVTFCNHFRLIIFKLSAQDKNSCQSFVVFQIGSKLILSLILLYVINIMQVNI